MDRSLACITVEKFMHGLSNPSPISCTLESSSVAGLGDRIKRAKMLRKHQADAIADMANSQPRKQSIQSAIARGIDRIDHVFALFSPIRSGSINCSFVNLWISAKVLIRHVIDKLID